jgi:WD40 repeat protein
MSGYRNIHRQDLSTLLRGSSADSSASTLPTIPVWHLTCGDVLLSKSKQNGWRFWTACGDGFVRGFKVQEKTLADQNNTDDRLSLDASACTIQHTHTLVDRDDNTKQIGCSQVQLTRNYVGQDNTAGDLVVTSVSLNGKVNVWILPETMDDQEESNAPMILTATHSFMVPNATGTCLRTCPPNVSHTTFDTMVVAVPCLDGTIAVISTGVPVHNPKHEIVESGSSATTSPGTVLYSFSKSSMPIAMSLAWHPHKLELAVGRKDGLVQILPAGNNPGKSHRMIQHEGPVRSLAFSPDGHLLCSASDDAMICLWDVSRNIPTLVNHALVQTNSWIFQITPLWDSRRFVSTTTDKVQVWTCESDMETNREVHTFDIDTNENPNAAPQSNIWISADSYLHQFKDQTMAAPPQQMPRMVSITEQGKLQIYTLEA